MVIKQEVFQKSNGGGYRVVYGPGDIDDLVNSIVDQLGAIEALAHPIPGEAIRLDLIILEASEIIRIAEQFQRQQN